MPPPSEVTDADQPPPPPYEAPINEAPICTVHDETFRGVWYPQLSIASMAQVSHLIGHLDHHSPNTDGSFSICIANGDGIFISQELYISIPETHRPALDTSESNRKVNLLLGGGSMAVAGSTYFPFILTTSANRKIRLVLRVYVLPNLSMGMFISQSGNTSFKIASLWEGRGNGPLFFFDFGTEQHSFQGRPVRPLFA